MSKYFLSRLLVNIPTLFVILLVVFVLINFIPGDPLDAFFSPTAVLNTQQRELLRQEMGLDQSTPARFILWIKQVVNGDLGYRYKDGNKVLDEIKSRILPTLLLALAGLSIGSFFGTFFGIISVRFYNKRFDKFFSFWASLTTSTPVFLIAIICVYIFSVRLKWLPSGGYSNPGDGGVVDVLYHLTLPATVLSLPLIAIVMRYTRSGLLEAMKQDYIRTAAAKGLSTNQILLCHALPNTLILTVTVVGVNFNALIGGAVFIETVFSWPGMGMLFLDAIESRDYPLIMGITLFMAIAVLIVNLLTDLLYSLIDQRIHLR